MKTVGVFFDCKSCNPWSSMMEEVIDAQGCKRSITTCHRNSLIQYQFNSSIIMETAALNDNHELFCFGAKVQTGLLSTKSNVRPSVVMQQNDLPTTLSSKWSFLFHFIEQISHLTAVAVGSNCLTWLKEFTKQHAFMFHQMHRKTLVWVLVTGRCLSTNVCV
uniref:Ovule protein n=1 Tax=Heterorhabditis bacteriophora TaxID=37862 RepID=A0A1I7WRA6_HETBA